MKRKYGYLIQEATFIQSPDGTVATKIRFTSKNQTVRIDNNRQGHDGTVKVEGKLTLAILLPESGSREAKIAQGNGQGWVTKQIPRSQLKPWEE